MHSLRTRITLLTVCVTVIAVSLVTLVSVLFIRTSKHRESEQMLLLLCETGQRNMDYFFHNVQRSVGKVAAYAEENLTGLEEDVLKRQVDLTEEYFEEMVSRTSSVLTYYYRINPEISSNVKGFWFTNLYGEGFSRHEVTDITLYDTEDTSKLVWFTVPKHTGEPVWLPPYITDNLDVRVISYNVPIYWRGQFVGVVGIEMDYSMLAEQVDGIRLYNNGYAFLCDEKGELFYHPRMDVSQMAQGEKPSVPDEAVVDSTFVRYTFDGVEKMAAWMPLYNGMRLYAAVPVDEMEGDWRRLVWEIIAISAVILLSLSSFTLFYTGRITRPLQELTEAAERLDKGNYEFDLQYDKDDEVGRLTATFRHLANHMKVHINDLNKRAYVDALTSVRNKGAFTDTVEKLQKRVDANSAGAEFAVGIFDCDDLKAVNDQYGHDKGDIYLKTSCRLICRVFRHSPVFRIGGDEFAVLFQNEDYRDRNELIRLFGMEEKKISEGSVPPWEQVHVTMGIAAYDPRLDRSVFDTIRRADKDMYARKRKRKGEKDS